MSRWLSQVTNYLEQLDDQAQDYVEERINAPAAGDEASNLDSILAQRGLAAATSEGDDEEEENINEDNDDISPFGSITDEAPENDHIVKDNDAVDDNHPQAQFKDDNTSSPSEEPIGQQDTTGQQSSEESDKKEDSKPAKNESTGETADKPVLDTNIEPGKTGDNEGSGSDLEKKDSPTATDAKVSPNEEINNKDPNLATPPPDTAPARMDAKPLDEAKAKPTPAPASVPKQAPPPPPPAAKKTPPPAPVVKDPNPALVKQAKEAQKEVRTLRKHVLTLNKQLESVEAEVTAQRKELEQAGENFEKERAKMKEKRDQERKAHAEELKQIQAQHEATLMDQKTRMEKQLEEMSKKLTDIEQTRMQEGGNWDKELQGAVEREQMLTKQNIALEDEKATLLAQISTLQSQQEALGDRIDSLSQTADSAMEREREAEMRLDQALSVHAHQISQRQARETELERTISELGAELAAVRNKESSRLNDLRRDSEISDTAGENTSQDSGLRVRLDMALHDLESMQANLDLERQRTEALQRELREINAERAEEATNARMKQNKHDRQIAELTLQLSRMQQQSTADNGKEGSERNDSAKDDADSQALRNQVKELSEEVLKAREKISGYSSEISTLKSRLKGALERAEKAEAALEENLAVQNSDSYDRMERGVSPASGNAMKRRGQRGGSTSISSAMHLNKTEKVGKAVDALDSFAVSTGKYLRSNPFARAGFIMYLVMLHLWTFVVIFFHAHNFEDIHRDDLPHGPDAIVQNQLGAGGQALEAAVKAAKQKQP